MLVFILAAIVVFFIINKLFLENSSTVKIISLEGNIGAGKTTILSSLKEYLNKMKIKNVFIIKEPVDVWERTNILAKFYSDKNKYAGFFQLFVLETLIDVLRNKIKECSLKKNKTIYIITERSIESTKWVFAQMLYDDKIINEEEMKCYMYVYGMAENKKYIPKGIIYLNTPPDICKQRILHRNRLGEDDIQENYLEKCYYYYNNMISFYKENKKILEIDYKENDNEEICKQIISFIKST